MKLSKFSKALMTSALLLAATVSSYAQQTPHDASTVAPVWRTDVTGSFTQQTPLIRLVPGGQATAIRLTGISNIQYLDFGVRADELVSQATLELAFTASPALIPIRSQINVFLNGQLQQSVPVTADALGKLYRTSVSLDPKQIKSVNQITLEFVGHYQNICERPSSETLWLNVDAKSYLSLVKQKVKIANDLARWPAPFIDTFTNNPTVIPFVFAKTPDSETKKAAAILSSLVGKHTQWRGADFPVYFNRVPTNGHFFVFATNSSRPAFLNDLPMVEGPQIFMMDAPESRSDKMLVIAGRDEADLVLAAKALASEDLVLIGDKLRIQDFKESPERQAYDAPNWVPIDETIAFSRIMQYPGQLTSRGYAPPPVHMPMSIAPDLYMVGTGGLDVNLKYRYTKPEGGDQAQLRMRINNYLIDSVNLSSQSSSGIREMRLPSFNGPLATSPSEALALAAQNDLSFEVVYRRELSEGSPDNCKSVVLLPHQMEIDPASTMTLNGLFHYAEMPNLTLFTQSAYPYSVYADLSRTAAVISKEASAEKVTTLLNTMARIASVTGAVATKLTVVDQASEAALDGKDILFIGEMPITLPDFKKENAEELQNAIANSLKGEEILQPEEVLFSPDGGVGAIVSLQSPFDSDRTVVALLSEGQSGSYLLNEQLKSPSSMKTVAGAVAIINEQSIVDFKVGDTYSIGDLPWYHKIWETMSNYPLLLVLCALICAVLVGTGIFYFMRLWVRGRAK
ncbi:cellulose biosynthesis cyclic di-GMP-binding regulatory protein BcsB [Parasutterella secunda]|uniref:Cyclic di-GMP-binding protein n=1 Tax=Parasutterella secunda TaxID=626947 RepID=A0ABS2GR58_9BURK|nr:cellulose biosynthesis cyclic di-GMP-binding regulatory protein BcsB [Parasutterella secunda]